MQRYKITIEYNGTNFSGWQRQENLPSVQQVVEEAIFKFSGETRVVYGSGRTDAGVHACGQVAHFDLIRKSSELEICQALNFHIKPHLISIISCEAVHPDFHARFHAIKRSYIYKILARKMPSALEYKRLWHVPYELDIDKMREAANHLIGHHDFTSFRASQCQSKSPLKTLSSIEIREKDNFLEIEVSAPSFLHHMVRNIVGTLVLVGRDKILPESIPSILAAKDRSQAGPKAPAWGLYFKESKY